MAAVRVLAVFAHPDDEVFCCGGTLAKYVAGGAEATILTATRGEAGQIRDASVATRATLGRVREAELRRAAACLGVQHVDLLDHVDGTLRDVDRAALTEEVAAAIEAVDPDVVITFGADGAYGHPDHIAIGEVTTAAFLDRPGGPRGRLFHSHFPRSRLLLLDRLSNWLVELNERFRGPEDFARVFSLFARETSALGYATDEIELGWFPPGVSIIEQGEPGTSLYLLLSGHADVFQDQDDRKRVYIRRMGPGEFFGEIALARQTVRTAHVVAADSVTCLVFSPGVATLYAGRGMVSNLESVDTSAVGEASGSPRDAATTVIDVSGFLDRKIAAIAAHRTQYPIDPSMFPDWMLREMMGREHFVRIHPPIVPEDTLLG